MTIGISTLIACVASMPKISSDPNPFWKTSTISPHAAPTERRFRRTALSGRSSERKARARRMKVRMEISASISGKLA